VSEPLSDDETEILLHDLMRRVLEANPATREGRTALRIALAGLYGALVSLERATSPPGPSQPPRR
jgi:hypothetical protein